MNELYLIKYLLEEIIEKQLKLETMSDMWENGSPEEQACSDPAMQYCLEREIESLIDSFKQMVSEF